MTTKETIFCRACLQYRNWMHIGSEIPVKSPKFLCGASGIFHNHLSVTTAAAFVGCAVHVDGTGYIWFSPLGRKELLILCIWIISVSLQRQNVESNIFSTLCRVQPPSKGKINSLIWQLPSESQVMINWLHRRRMTEHWKGPYSLPSLTSAMPSTTNQLQQHMWMWIISSSAVTLRETRFPYWDLDYCVPCPSSRPFELWIWAELVLLWEYFTCAAELKSYFINGSCQCCCFLLISVRALPFLPNSTKIFYSNEVMIDELSDQ